MLLLRSNNLCSGGFCLLCLSSPHPRTDNLLPSQRANLIWSSDSSPSKYHQIPTSSAFLLYSRGASRHTCGRIIARGFLLEEERFGGYSNAEGEQIPNTRCGVLFVAPTSALPRTSSSVQAGCCRHICDKVPNVINQSCTKLTILRKGWCNTFDSIATCSHCICLRSHILINPTLRPILRM